MPWKRSDLWVLGLYWPSRLVKWTDHGSLCLEPTAQVLLADCITGASLFIPPQSLLRRAARYLRVFENLLPAGDETYYHHELEERQNSALATLWSIYPIPGMEPLAEIHNARAGLNGGICLRTDMYVGQCQDDVTTVFSTGGSALFPPVPPAQPPANLGLIIGCVVGGLAAIALIGMGICLWRRRKANKFDREIKASSSGIPGAAPENVAAPLFDPKAHVELAPLPTGMSSADVIGGRPVSMANQPRASGVPTPQAQPAPMPLTSYQSGAAPAAVATSALAVPYAAQPQVVAGPQNAAQIKDLNYLRGKQCVVIQPYAGKLQDEVPIERGDVVQIEQA